MTQVKFLKQAVPDILAGNKTMEARPRSLRWIAGFKAGQTIELTWGSRFAPPTVFATAQIEKIETKPFSAATPNDVVRFGGRLAHLPVSQFSAELERWYAAELAKGKIVVWIYFHLIESDTHK